MAKLLIHSQNSTAAANEVWEWICYFIPHFTGHVITNPCWDYSLSMLGHVKGALMIQGHATSKIAIFMGHTWGTPGSCRPQVCPMWAPWTCYQGWSQNPMRHMTISWHGNNFRITGPLCKESTDHQWNFLFESRSPWHSSDVAKDSTCADNP